MLSKITAKVVLIGVNHWINVEYFYWYFDELSRSIANRTTGIEQGTTECPSKTLNVQQFIYSVYPLPFFNV
jgi:hypothetical protein